MLRIALISLRVHRRQWRPLLLLCLLALTLAGCGVLGGLDSRAATYYNYLIGRYPKQAYSSYLSPAYKKKFSRNDLRALDESHRKGSKPNLRYPLARAGDVLVQEQDKFAWTVVDPALGDAFAVQQPQRWVKVGLNWYIYSGSQAEVDAYGVFPPELAPAPLVEFEKKHEAERKKQRERQGKQDKSAKSGHADEAGESADGAGKANPAEGGSTGGGK